MYIGFLQRRVILVQQDNDLFAIIARQIARQGVQGTCRQIVFHLRRYPAEVVLFFPIQTAAFQQKIVLIIQFSNNLANLSPGVRKCPCFHFGKRKADDRISPLDEPVALLLPDGKAFEQLSSPRTIYREKLLHHTHVQCLAEAPRTGNQGHAVLVFPPFPDEAGFVYIKKVFCNDCLKVLMSNADCPCHKLPPNMMISCM